MGEWYVRQVSRGLLYIELVETPVTAGGVGLEFIQYAAEGRYHADRDGQTIWTQAFMSIEKARLVIARRGFLPAGDMLLMRGPGGREA